jgi:hypothetical protein
MLSSSLGQDHTQSLLPTCPSKALMTGVFCDNVALVI